MSRTFRKKKVEKETKAEEKKDDKKKVAEKLEKKSIASAIIENNIKAKDIENILDELQVGYDEEDNDVEDVVNTISQGADDVLDLFKKIRNEKEKLSSSEKAKNGLENNSSENEIILFLI